MANPNCCFMIIAVTFFFSSQSPRGTVSIIWNAYYEEHSPLHSIEPALGSYRLNCSFGKVSTSPSIGKASMKPWLLTRAICNWGKPVVVEKLIKLSQQLFRVWNWKWTLSSHIPCFKILVCTRILLLLWHGFPLTQLFPGPKNCVKGGVPVLSKNLITK